MTFRQITTIKMCTNENSEEAEEGGGGKEWEKAEKRPKTIAHIGGA